MDPFTQRMLEKAEQRSRALGISSAGKFPLGECSSDANASSGVASQEKCETQQQQKPHLLALRSPASAHASTNITNSSIGSASSGGSNKLQVVEKTPLDAASMTCNTPNKVLRQFSAVDKENMEMGIEINIMTDKDVEVQVQVEEQEITDEEGRGREVTNQPLAKIRDTSRNRLQRLGALYSNPNDLSSPIHRTEGQFHADENELDGSPKRPKQRYGKLAALANSINQWEDDTAHNHQPTVPASMPPPKPDLPSRVSKKAPAPAPPTSPQVKKQPTVKQMTVTEKHIERGGGDADCLISKTKQLKWDPKVINSLEAQGFQRRESSTVRLAYDYSKEDDEGVEEAPKELGEKPKVAKLLTPFTIPSSNVKANVEEKKPKVSSVKPGLVSGRAAAFESKASAASQPMQRPQKDPTELSLKERMQLFERNKGEALMPKAAFGMAPSINQIRQDGVTRKEEAMKAATSNVSTAPALTVATVKPGTESKLRDKVAALVANAATMSENKIKAEIQKQREEDMQILANRFHKQKEISPKDEQPQTQTQQTPVKPTAAASKPTGGVTACPPPPPPPPPMPVASSKRRSPGDSIEDDESKRARKSATAMSRLYPALSDLESNESLSDNDHCGTTATMSGRSTADEQQKLLGTAGVTQATDANADDVDNDSYMESEEADDDSSVGICNGSLGREIMQVVQKKDNQQRQAHKQPQVEKRSQQQQQRVKQMKEVHYADRDDYYGGAAGCDSSMNSSEASMGVDDYLDEALDDDVDDGDDDCTQESEEDENTSRASRGSKGTTASNSFSFRKTPKKYTNCQTISEEGDDFQSPHTATSTATSFTQPVRSELSVNQEDENMVTLVHTVSFYRRQQNSNSACSTPVRKICREQQVLRSEVESAACAALKIDVPPKRPEPEIFVSTIEDCSDVEGNQYDIDNDDAQNLVQEKIKKLLDEVCKQQTVIAQTSQALNLCAATVEFSGSTESVEGERHLLVATHRRQACLDEVQRLRVEKSLRPLGAPREKGCVTVKEITIPLRQDYIRKLAADTISGHHLVCLLKYNEHVLATKTVPTLPGLLAVKFPDVLQMNHVYADFRITLEIYGMTAQREVLPHEVKYHINLNKKSGIRTPKKKGSDNRLIMPPVQSPAGPNAVRTPALVQYGFAIFSLREMQRTSWTLTQVLGVSPLEGVVHMKVNCELSVSVEHKGFLTMFEDISGFGAWHRRWCQLNGTVLNYWKYPDDEKKKAPMGSIDLYTCITQKATLAPRDICARLNTMLLECQRPAREGDEESLIIVPNGPTTIVRYLLSADTKEEREQWCAYFNKALTLLRAWGPPQ